MHWLIEKNILDRMRQAQALGVVPTVAQQAAFESRRVGGGGSSPLLTVVGDTAQILIEGVLTQRPNFLAFLFGGGNTTFDEIVVAVEEAENLEAVKKIELSIDSPGGTFAGLFDAIDALQAAEKPMTAIVSNLAASAAFAIASQADTIVAKSRAATFGSIGIVATFIVFEHEVEITSTEAPNKRPDVTTDEGRAIVRAQLDEMHALFVGAIATGRKTDVETVNKDFGRGSIMLADSALERGMIDSVETLTLVSLNKQAKSVANKVEPQEKKQMDLATLRTEHPELYAKVVALGSTQERDRVMAHLTMGEASGTLKIAIEAIKDGTEMTQAKSAEYMAAGLNRKDVETRQGDDTDVADGNESVDDEDAEAKQVLAKVQSRLGVSENE